jgi:hypothetical protein
MELPILDDHRLLRERNLALKLASIAYHTALLKTSPDGDPARVTRDRFI